ncbi:MAG: endonuclease/exonuclease/phosphatase family protein, partial [Sinomicrobium sp.]|nr:endonuclease/exonuclease/phosphatase family protein [Sinomicrobium sp.]
AEVENRKVLEDFVQQDAVKDRHYQIVHHESPDRRGIDVALLYQSKYYKVTENRAIPLLIYNDQGERVYTRDILLVGGSFDGDPLYILVNHWPSRSGGESATRDYRNAGALRCKEISDSLSTANPGAKVIIMGDLNDDPVSPSVKKVLGAQGDITRVKPKGFFNPMYDLYRKGIGTLAYRDAWSLFDQILLNYAAVSPKAEGYHYYRTQIHNPAYLIQQTGKYKGYPFRTFDFDNYMGGYSDHFPVYVYLVKEI